MHAAVPRDARRSFPKDAGARLQRAAMQPTPRRLGFGAELRLRSKLQFDAIYAGGRRIDDRFFGTARQAQWAHASSRRSRRGGENRGQRRRAKSPAAPGARELSGSRSTTCRRSTSWWPQNFPRVKHRRQRCVLASRPFGNASQRHALRPEISDPRVPARHQPVARAALPFLSVVLALRDRSHRNARRRCAACGSPSNEFPVVTPGTKADSIRSRPVSIIRMTNNIRVFLWLGLALALWLNYSQWQIDYGAKPARRCRPATDSAGAPKPCRYQRYCSAGGSTSVRRRPPHATRCPTRRHTGAAAGAGRRDRRSAARFA